MKNIKYILGLMTLSLITMSSCEKETMDYEGQDGLYFDVRWGAEWGDPENEWAHQYYTPIEFGQMVEASYDVHLRVKTTGTIKDYDRPFTVIVNKDSTNAIAGEDYDGLGEQYVIKAGETCAYIDFTMYRTERMADENVYIQLKLQPNEYFTLPFEDYGDSPGHWSPETVYTTNSDASVHKVVANNYLVQPGGWWGADTGGGTFGKFSLTKFRLMMELTDTTIDDYESMTIMPLGRANAISESLARYLLEQAAKGREYAVLDEDGTMMWCSYIEKMGGSNAWAAFTKPEDYYK